MSVLNRNIITSADVDALRAATTLDEIPPALRDRPPANTSVPARRGHKKPRQTDPPAEADEDESKGEEASPTKDDYLAKVAKYIPPEVLAAYLLLDSVVLAGTKDNSKEEAWWLFGLLLGSVVAVVAYNKSVLEIVRKAQNTMSVVGFVVYVYAIGGWFATIRGYEAWHATFAIVTFGLLVNIVKLRPLPAELAEVGGQADPRKVPAR